MESKVTNRFTFQVATPVVNEERKSPVPTTTVVVDASKATVRKKGTTKLRQLVMDEIAKLRQEMHSELTKIRHEMARYKTVKAASPPSLRSVSRKNKAGFSPKTRQPHF